MADCLQVSVNVASTGSIPDVLISAVGGTLGAVLGLVVGLLILKCFFIDILRRYFKKKPHNVAKRLDHIENISSRDQVQPQKSDRSKLWYQGTNISTSHTVEEPEEEADIPLVEPTLLLRKHLTSGLIDVVMAKSLEIKLHELKTQEDCYLQSMQAIAWEHRHTCLLQTFKMIVTQYFKREQLSSHEFTQILTAAEKRFARSLGRYCHCIYDEHKRLIQATNGLDRNMFKETSQAAYQMVEDLRTICSKFEVDILDGQDQDTIHSGLVKVVEMIEMRIQALHDIKLEDIKSLSHRKLLVVQAYHGGNISLLEAMRTRRSYMETILQRLAKAGHVNQEDSGRTWNEFRVAIETAFDEISAHSEGALMKLQQQSVEQRKSTFQQLEMGQSKAVQQLLDRGGQKFKIRNFLEQYFTTLAEFHERESTAAHEITNNEAAKAAQLQKAAKLNLSARCDEAQERLLLALVENGALGVDTARQLTEELLARTKQADEEVSAVNIAQSKLVEREAKLTGEITWNGGGVNGHVTMDGITSEHRKIAKKFLEEVSYLDDSDRTASLHEYDVGVFLLRNLATTVREHAFRTFDRQLMDHQVRAISHIRGDQQLKTDADIQALAQKLGDMREKHFTKYGELYKETGTLLYDTWLKQQNSFVCGIAAKKLVTNLIAMDEEERLAGRLMTGIKREFAATLRRKENFDEAELQPLVEEHRHQVGEVERNLRQSHDLQLQMSKERLSSAQQHKLMKLHEKDARLLNARPQSASSLSIPEVLDRLLEQARNQRRIEGLESEGEMEMANHVYSHRLAFSRTLNSELQKLDKVFLYKVGQAANLSRKQFMQCVRDGLLSASASDEVIAAWTQEFSRLWPKRGNILGRSTSRAESVRWAPDAGVVQKRGRKGRSFLKRVAHAQT